MSRCDDLDREALIRLLERRDAERPLGLVGSATRSMPTVPSTTTSSPSTSTPT